MQAIPISRSISRPRESVFIDKLEGCTAGTVKGREEKSFGSSDAGCAADSWSIALFSTPKNPCGMDWKAKQYCYY